MDIPDRLVPEHPITERLRSLWEKCSFQSAQQARNDFQRLRAAGLEPEHAWKWTTWGYGMRHYGRPPSPETLDALWGGILHSRRFADLLAEQVFSVKAGWLFEHAPYYLYGSEQDGSRRFAMVADYARRYRSAASDEGPAAGDPSPEHLPGRILASTFWDSRHYDPVQWVRKAVADGIEGVELAVDFHPFNPVRALPEEIRPEQRRRIRSACRGYGVRIDLHAPCIGPNRPDADPKTGSPAFSHPAGNPPVYRDTVDLARDIGAASVVVHLIEPGDTRFLADLVAYAAGSPVRVTMENACMTPVRQDAEMFLACADEVFRSLPAELSSNHFGVTLDLGHFNVEGEDPLAAAHRVGRWCRDKGVFLRVHATDNYGRSHFRQPAHSPGLHGNVSGRGIPSAAIVKMLRSMGLVFDVVAEQSHPLTPRDIATIHEAQTEALQGSDDAYTARGARRLADTPWREFIDADKLESDPYRFLAGLEGPRALAEYLLYRRIQAAQTLSVEEADRVYRQFMRMPSVRKVDLADYVDELLTLMRYQLGDLSKKDVDGICQNISGALFGTISNENLDQIFSKERTFRKGQTICRQNGPGREMYYVKSGQVLVYIDQLCVAVLGPGEIAGEMSLFYDIRRSATLVALESDTCVGVLDRSDLELLFRSEHPYAHDLIYRFFKTLPGRLRNINERYKAAIHNLHLLAEGDPGELASLHFETEDVVPASSAFFPDLTAGDIGAVASGQKRYIEGEMLFREGEEGAEAFFLLEGSVRVFARPPGGSEIVFGTLEKGDLFGEMALIDDRPRSASVQALSAVRVAVIEKTAFADFIEERSPLAMRLMGFVNLALFRRILRLDRTYSDLKKRFVTAPKRRRPATATP